MLINEIIRITYKCNQKCLFCNVLETNNFDNDVSNNEIINQILNLKRKYKNDIKNIILSFSGGEPTLHPQLKNFIKIAKKIGIKEIQIQTNGILIYQNINLLEKLYKNGLTQIFLAIHSNIEEINNKLGFWLPINLLNKGLNNLKNFKKKHKKFQIQINIVITKINLKHIIDLLEYLIKNNFITIFPKYKNSHLISFGFVQPNGYARLNKKKVLLTYNKEEINEIKKIINYCKNNNIILDFHYTTPPLCVLNYPEYNLEYRRLKNLNNLEKNFLKNNIEGFLKLKHEKTKFNLCKYCKYNPYCLGFYKNFVKYVGKYYIIENFIKKFITN